MSNLPTSAWLKDPGHFLALGGGSGLAPRAPGTFGSMVGVGVYALMAALPLPLYLVLTALMFALGIPLCGRTARALGVHDHPAIVWDEVAAMPVVLLSAGGDWRWMLVGFALFRLFDIWKPWPIRWVDRRIHGGLGIMLDDLGAALLAAAALVSCQYFAYFQASN